MTHYAGGRLCACVPHVCVCGRRAKRQIIFLELFCAYLAGRGESSAPRFYGRFCTQFSALPIFCAVDFSMACAVWILNHCAKIPEMGRSVAFRKIRKTHRWRAVGCSRLGAHTLNSSRFVCFFCLRLFFFSRRYASQCPVFTP